LRKRKKKRTREEDGDESWEGKDKVHPRAIHECVNEWVSYGYTTYVEADWEWENGDGRHRASLWVTVDGVYEKGMKRCW
jgi:hypothetical protein